MDYYEDSEDEATKYPGPYDPGPEALVIQNEIRELGLQLLKGMNQRTAYLAAMLNSRTPEPLDVDKLNAKGQEIMDRVRQLLGEYKEAVRRHHNCYSKR